MMEFSSIIAPLIDLEYNMAKLYDYFCKRFDDPPEATMLFRKMKREEHSHADLLKFQKRTISKDHSKSMPVNIDMDSVHKLNHWIQSFLDDIPEISLEDALRLAIKIEKNAAEQHYRTAVKKANPELGQLVERLGSCDLDHSKKLTDFVKQFDLDVDLTMDE